MGFVFCALSVHNSIWLDRTEFCWRNCSTLQFLLSHPTHIESIVNWKRYKVSVVFIDSKLKIFNDIGTQKKNHFKIYKIHPIEPAGLSNTLWKAIKKLINLHANHIELIHRTKFHLHAPVVIVSTHSITNSACPSMCVVDRLVSPFNFKYHLTFWYSCKAIRFIFSQNTKKITQFTKRKTHNTPFPLDY